MQATDIPRIDPVEPARFERDYRRPRRPVELRRWSFAAIAAEFRDLTVATGDLLYIPSMWWHQARSLTTSFAVNLWWLKGPKVAVARLAELYMRVRGLDL